MPASYFLGSSIVQRPAPAALPSGVAPTFGGITGLVQQADGSLTASWAGATVVPNPPVRYEVYLKASSVVGLFSLSNIVGVTSNLSLNTACDAVPMVLMPGTTYFVGVRAVDTYSNRETNVVSLSATVTNANFNTLAQSVWSVLRNSSVAVGTFGEALQSKVDVDVSSRAAATTALSNAQWTNARAAALDNLDASVTSRAPASSALSNAQWTNARAAALDNLDVSVSAVKQKTDQMLFDGSSNIRSNSMVVGDKTGYALSSSDKIAIADAVWSTVLAVYTNPAQAGAILNGLGAGSTPSGIAAAVWNSLRATYTAGGSFGEALQGVLSVARANKLDFLDAAITSRASQTTLDSYFGNVSTLVTNLQTTSSGLQTTASQTAATEVELAGDVADLGVLNNSIADKLSAIDPNAITAIIEKNAVTAIIED
jgi:hypothetical protein